MTDDPRHRLFLKRSHHLRVEVAAGDASTGSRIGGRPPANCRDGLSCPSCGGRLCYYLSIDLAEAIDLPTQVSCFFCRQFSCLLGSAASGTPPTESSIVVVNHAPSPRCTDATAYDSDIEPRALRILQEMTEPTEPAQPSEHSKLGGRPYLVQDEGIDLHLEKAGLHFLFQWSELDFPRNMRIGTYPFAAGILYLFCTFTSESQPDLRRVQAFWQRS